MARIIAICCALAVCAVACESGEQARQGLEERAAAVTKTAPKASSATAPSPDGPAYLLWVDPKGADGPHTAWINADSVRARRRGIVVAAGGHLWKWADAGLDLDELDCVCVREHEQQQQNKASPAQVAQECGHSHELTSHALITLEGNDGLSPITGVAFGKPRAQTRLSIDAMSSVGPYVFARVCRSQRQCGESKETTLCQPYVADLERKAPVHLDDVAAPLAHGAGRQALSHALETDDAAAPKLSELADLPAPVAAELAKYPDAEAAGFSEVPKDAALRATLWGRFSALP